MDQKLARTLLMSVNDVKVLSALNDYVTFRLERLRDQLETTKDDRRVSELQGAIEEIRRIYRLRDDFIAVTKQKET